MANPIKEDSDYNYTSSGIDEFFTRQQDLGGVLSESIPSQGGLSELNLDSLQVGGSLGSVFKIGERFSLDGVTGTMDIYDSDGRVVIRISSEES